jgi:hypothetical protein
MSHLVYSKFSFGNKKESPLAEFKRRNGFEQLNFIRYYIPVTVKGKIALTLKLHRGVLGNLPPGLISFLLKWRSRLWRALMIPYLFCRSLIGGKGRDAVAFTEADAARRRRSV